MPVNCQVTHPTHGFLGLLCHGVWRSLVFLLHLSHKLGTRISATIVLSNIEDPR